MYSRPRKYLTFLPLSLILLTLPFFEGCESSEPTSVPSDELPSFEILDAASADGNPDFFFLPPMVPDPSGTVEFDAGAFDPGLTPTVEVWALPSSEEAAATLTATFDMAGTETTDPIVVYHTDELYQVNWHLADYELDPAVTYQIRVFLGDNRLGYADLDLVSSGRELKNVDTGEFIPLKDGRTLPIKFRLEEGVGSNVGAAGGTVLADDGSWSVEIQPGTFETPVQITGTPITPPEDALEGTAWAFGPAGTPFNPPARLTIWYNPEDLTPGKYPRLHRLVGDEWVPVEESVSDLAAGSVSAPVEGFSHWTIIEGQLILTVDIREGNGFVWVDGLACGREETNPCELGYDVGETVVLKADTDTDDARFEEWIGSWGDPAPCMKGPICEFTISEDTDVIARFSMPGFLTIEPFSASFSVAYQDPELDDPTAVLTVSNIGGRTATVEEIPITYAPDVAAWLELHIADRSIDPGESEPATLTLQSSIASSLFPGEYSAQVPILTGGGMWGTGGVVPVTLTVSTAGPQLEADGTGILSGYYQVQAFSFTDDTGADLYPVGADDCSSNPVPPCYWFGLFDTGSDIVHVDQATSTNLGIGTASKTNPNQDTRVRMSGISVIEAATDPWPPFGPVDAPGGGSRPHEVEIQGIRVGPPGIGRLDRGVTLLGAPVANEVTVFIDQTTTILRGPYCAGPDCMQPGSDIRFFMPTDPAIPTPEVRVQLERFGTGTPSTSIDDATRGFRYLTRNIAFWEGVRMATDHSDVDPPLNFFIDTGSPKTIVNVKVADALNLDRASGGQFDCFEGPGKEGFEGYEIDHVTLIGPGPAGGSYTVNQAWICVDVRDEEIRTSVAAGVKVDAIIGMNLFMHGPILFEGKDDRLGLFPPGS